MRARRRMRGFERVGALRPDQIGLPRNRARELALAVGWQSVAGAVVARQAPALRVFRGVLEIQPTDRRWRETLWPMLPGLAGRLAVECPGLKIRKVRLVGAGDDGSESEAVPIEIPDRDEAR